MKRLYLNSREQWRQWLAQHSDTEAGVWLIFYRKETGKPTIDYEAAVEEALCFGWIDGILRKLDDARYVRKFTPRRDKSGWSALNKERAERMIRQGKMTEAGLAKIKAAKKSGRWDEDPRPEIPFEVPPEFAKALAQSKKAKSNFETLAPSHRRHYIAWVAVAKKAETKKRRIAESIALLEKGEKLGLR